MLDRDGRAWWMIRNFVWVDHGRIFWLIDVSAGVKKWDRRIARSESGHKIWAIRVEGTAIRKTMKWDFWGLERSRDCIGGMRITRKGSGGEIFARRGDLWSLKCRSGWPERRRRISQHLSVRYGKKNRARRIRWWGAERCKELLEHRRGHRIIIRIQICERWNLRETADGDFGDVPWLRMNINAG
jgi:hypothetical protein